MRNGTCIPDLNIRCTESLEDGPHQTSSDLQKCPPQCCRPSKGSGCAPPLGADTVYEKALTDEDVAAVH